jgi:hypothetical protein
MKQESINIMTQNELLAKLHLTNDKEERFSLHREYWGSYVKKFNIKAPDRLIPKCKAALQAGDRYFNSPHTQLNDWDRLLTSTQSNFKLCKALRENGEGNLTLSINICLLKEAAMQQVEAELTRVDNDLN